MVRCEVCGKQTDLPFRCNYCGELLCSEHRLPENHECPNLPNEAPEYIREKIPEQRKTHQKEELKNYQPLNSDDEFVSQGPLHFEKGPGWKKAQKKKRNITLASLLIVIFFVALVMILVNPNILGQNQISPNKSNISPSAIPTITIPSPTLSVTVIPANSESSTDLVDYALNLINSDRQSHSLQNVSLSSINSGQQHAEDMLNNGYFSHWDLQGYKPYMRYTLAGGKGAVAENCAWMWSTGSITDIKDALNNLEHSMMYDDASSNWGHKDNILESSHNAVSIGIAYDSSHVYLVQDFEDDYVDWTTLTSSSGQTKISGTLQSSVIISQVAVYYDKVSTLTAQQLSNAPYQDGYDPGTYVGEVVTPAAEGSYYVPPDEGILIEASSWVQTSQSFDIAFDLSSVFVQSGTGVYTLYLWTDSGTYLTTYSIWYSG
jgi:uncharacterized protein YkwD